MTSEAKISTIKALAAKGAHLVRVGADKRPFDKAWQEAPWTGEGAFEEVGCIPGRSGLLVADVDVAGEAQQEVWNALVDALGCFPTMSCETPSGGVHMYWWVGPGAPIPNWKMQWGDLRCDSGYVVLWGSMPRRLLDCLCDERPLKVMGRDEVMARLAPMRKAPPEAPGATERPVRQGGRGHVEGDRNNGLYDKCVAALANDADPEPAIGKAIEQALAAGSPEAEVLRSVASARKSRAAEGAKAAEVPPGTSALGKVVLGWRAEVEGVLVTREHEISAKALRRVDSIVRRDTTDAIHRMHEVSRAWGEGGDPSVEALYRSRVAEMVRGGLDWTQDDEPLWLVEGMIPLHRLVFLFAEGGLGKTRLAIQLALGAASGCGLWLPGSLRALSVRVRAPLKVLFISWEDTERAVRRALRHAGKVLGVEDIEAAIGDRFEFYYAGKLGPLWAPSGGSGHISTLSGFTDAGLWVQEIMPHFDLVILDPLAAMYGSDENQRGLVRAFVSRWDESAQDAGCTLLVLGHSSREYLASGSTDWQNAVRAVLGLQVVESKGKDPNDGRRQVVSARGVRLKVVKLNEARKPMPVWLAPGSDGDGWIAVTREASERAFPVPEK